MRILIYGGSFNPIHKAHIENIKVAMNKIAFDKVVIVPNKVSHFKDNNAMASDYDRLKMIELAIDDLSDKIEVSDIELKANKKYYTTDLVDEIKKEYKDSKLFFLIGSDQAQQLSKWYDIENLKRKVVFIVTKREENYFDDKLIVLNNQVLSYSSTAIRQDYESSGIVAVDDYIRGRGLYLKEYINKHLSEKRAKHTCNVAQLAVEIAQQNNVDVYKAYIAAMLHDIAKETPLKEQYSYIDNQFKLFELTDTTVHQYAACWIVKNKLKINDSDILSAISKHTTAYFEMSILDKIIYCADMLEVDRNFSGIEKLRVLLYTNINECFKECFIASYNFLIDKRVKISEDLKKLREKVERNEV